MTKAEQIRSLYDGTRTTAEIAEIVGCLPSYVRVVARQRVDGMTNTEMKYRAKLESEMGRPYWALIHERYRDEKITYARTRRRCLSLGHSREFANQKAREAYATAKGPIHRSIFVEFNGEKMTLSELSRRTGADVRKLSWRIANGWSVQEALKNAQEFAEA